MTETKIDEKEIQKVNEERIEELQFLFNDVEDLRRDILKDAEKIGYYLDEDNKFQKIEYVWVVDIDFKYLERYLGDSDWIIKYGQGTNIIEEDKVKEIIDKIQEGNEEDGFDLDSISEIIGDVFGWRHYELEDIPLNSAKIEEGTLENGDLNILFNVVTEVDENRFEECGLRIYREEKQNVDMEYWEETGCR